MIGVFDSGIGGLSVLRDMIPYFEDDQIVYVADRANAPYGTRSLQDVQDLSHHIASRLIGLGASTVVVACNTASAGALTSLRTDFPSISFVGMEPAVKPAAAATKTGIIGVLATEVTFQGELFASLVDQYAGDLEILMRVAPEWVQMVERGVVDSTETELLVLKHVEPLIEGGADTLVLGCTHFPFLAASIQRIAGEDVTIIDPAHAVARQADRIHDQRSGSKGLQALVSGDMAEFQILSRDLAGITFSGGVLPLDGMSLSTAKTR